MPTWLLTGLGAVAIAAALCAGGLYLDNQAKQRRIETLQGDLKQSRGETAAAEVLARRRPQTEARYGELLAAINAAGERTSDACLTDPRVLAYYDGFRLRNAERDAAEGRTAH